MFSNNESLNSLCSSAVAARDFAYAPYSKFAVGAAVLSADNKIFSAGNIENASYGLTICAERAAIFCAIAAGCDKLIALAVATTGGIYPCGACRQVFAEFATDDAAILIIDVETGNITSTSLGEILPNSFRMDTQK